MSLFWMKWATFSWFLMWPLAVWSHAALKSVQSFVSWLSPCCLPSGGRCIVFLWHQTGPQTSGAPRSRRCERKTRRRKHDRSQQTILAPVYVLVGASCLATNAYKLFFGHKEVLGQQVLGRVSKAKWKNALSFAPVRCMDLNKQVPACTSLLPNRI